VRDGKVTREVKYLYAYDEEKLAIAQANAVVDETGAFEKDEISTPTTRRSSRSRRRTPSSTSRARSRRTRSRPARPRTSRS
jgi:hypothetical protein